MNDTEIRGIVLRKFYDKRREGRVRLSSTNFGETADFDEQDLFRACEQLAELGLIEWRPVRLLSGTVNGDGKIKAPGIDVIEGKSKAPASITLDQSISVHGSSNVQIGSHNIQDFSVQIVSAIDHSAASDEEKAEAKSLLKKFLEHPLVTSIAGGLASTIKP